MMKNEIKWRFNEIDKWPGQGIIACRRGALVRQGYLLSRVLHGTRSNRLTLPVLLHKPWIVYNFA